MQAVDAVSGFRQWVEGKMKDVESGVYSGTSD
jgi:hypothetical protein